MVRLAVAAIALSLLALLILYVLNLRLRRRGRPTAARPSRASRHLQTQLIKLMHGDRQGAERLIHQAKLKYSGKSEDWYCEKVIFDLERDRWR